ncbi:hypothetical protein [Staphylococcus phage vB_SauH_DELF3]|nr:hypothetical protein [Staphylococcus phage vB_SauH_DELF3]
MDNLSHYLSVKYAVLVTVGYIPGIIALVIADSVKRARSVFMYLIESTVAIHLTALFGAHAPLFLIIVVSINLPLGRICFIIDRFRTIKVRLLEMVMFIIVIYSGTSVANYSVEYGQIIAPITIIFAYVTQITSFYKTKSAEGTNRRLSRIISLDVDWKIYSMLITNTTPHVIYTELSDFILITICYLQASDFDYSRGCNIE